MASLSHRFAVRLVIPLLTAGTLAVAAPAATLAAQSDSATRSALATERYLSSYGAPRPLPPAAADVASSNGPSWIAAILAGTGLAIGAGLAGIAGGRAIARPRHAAS